ncbi:MAG: hypothetical protein MUQ26_08245, partial [Armatimonadetes bacterium]|nr:hypothetical protein [Armatimonadota bacterium]
MTAANDKHARTDAFRSLDGALKEFLGAERAVLAAPCSRYTLEQCLRAAVRLAPDTRLNLLLANDRPLWRGRAADLLAAVGREVTSRVRGFSPSRSTLRSLRLLRPGAFLVLADEERSASRWAQLLGILSGAHRVGVLSTFDRSLRSVRPADCLIFAGRTLRTEFWQ